MFDNLNNYHPLHLVREDQKWTGSCASKALKWSTHSGRWYTRPVYVVGARAAALTATVCATTDVFYSMLKFGVSYLPIPFMPVITPHEELENAMRGSALAISLLAFTILGRFSASNAMQAFQRPSGEVSQLKAELEELRQSAESSSQIVSDLEQERSEHEVTKKKNNKLLKANNELQYDKEQLETRVKTISSENAEKFKLHAQEIDGLRKECGRLVALTPASDTCQQNDELKNENYELRTRLVALEQLINNPSSDSVPPAQENALFISAPVHSDFFEEQKLIKELQQRNAKLEELYRQASEQIQILQYQANRYNVVQRVFS